MWTKICARTIDVCLLMALVSWSGATVAKYTRKLVEEVKGHGRNPQ
jgi:hypothetical protein